VPGWHSAPTASWVCGFAVGLGQATVLVRAGARYGAAQNVLIRTPLPMNAEGLTTAQIRRVGVRSP